MNSIDMLSNVVIHIIAPTKRVNYQSGFLALTAKPGEHIMLSNGFCSKKIVAIRKIDGFSGSYRVATVDMELIVSVKQQTVSGSVGPKVGVGSQRH